MSYNNQGFDYNSGYGYTNPQYPAAVSTTYQQQYGSVPASIGDNSGYGYGFNNWQGYGYNAATGTSGQTSTGSGFGGYAAKKKQKKEPPLTIQCETCNVSCANQDAYTAHITGRKHAVQERKKLQGTSTNGSTSSTNNSQRYQPYQQQDTKKFFCELCNCASTDQNTFNLHLAGKKHQTTLQKKARAAAAGQAQIAQPTPSHGTTGATPSTTPSTTPSLTPTPSPPLQSPQLQPQAAPASDSTSSSTPSTSPSPQPRYSPHYKKNRPSGPFRRHNNSGNNNNSQRNARVFAPVALTMAPTDINHDNLLHARHAELSPGSATTMNLNALVNSLTSRLNELGTGKHADDPTNVIVNEVKLVGPYASSTLMKANPMADIVIITKDPPNTNTLAALYDVLMKTAADTNVSFDHESTEIVVQAHDYGARVMVTWLGAWSAKKIVIMVHEEDKVVEEKEEIKVTPQASGPANMSTTKTSTTTTTTTITTTTTSTPPTELPGGESAAAIDMSAPAATIEAPQSEAQSMETESTQDLALINQGPSQAIAPTENLEGVNIKACQQALLAIRQMLWFKDHLKCPNICNVLRLLMDFRSRVAAFQPLSPWALEVIIVNALRGTPQSASISQSMRSLFAYIASGVLLPGVELIDPCEQEPVHVLRMLSPSQRLEVTSVAQEVIREIAYGKWDKIVGV